MLQSIKLLYGDKLGASDGEIGHVKDFYFDDQSWAVRYLIVDTGSWLTGRQVLLSPHAFDGLHQSGKLLLVHLTRHQIEKSPLIEKHKPLSRLHEEEYYRYYGWPSYWQGDGLWGGGGFPIGTLPAGSLPDNSAKPDAPLGARPETHLRSTQAVTGYNVTASDGTLGHVCDFLMDSRSWAIQQLIVKTGHRISGAEIQIPVKQVDRISYDESTVFLNLSKAAVEQNPARHLAAAGTTD